MLSAQGSEAGQLRKAIRVPDDRLLDTTPYERKDMQ